MKLLTCVTGLALLLGCGANTLLLAADPPSSGTSVEGYEPFDQAVIKFRDKLGCTAGTIAISKDGKLIYSRGFGWQDRAKSKPVPPDTLMRLGSVTKLFTAAAIKESIRAGHLKPTDLAFEHVKMKAPGGKPADERINQITITHLLDHKGGWEEDPANDVLFNTRELTKFLKLSRPAEAKDAVAYMLTRQLNFTPGKKVAYSNFGYIVLGRVLESVEKKATYYEALRELVLDPAGISDVKPGSTLKRDPKEVYYPVTNDQFRIEVVDSTAGLIASAPGLCGFLDRYWVTGDRRMPGQTGQGVIFGSIPGTTTLIQQRTDGVNIAVLFNGRREKTIQEDIEYLKDSLTEAADKVFKKK